MSADICHSLLSFYGERGEAGRKAGSGMEMEMKVEVDMTVYYAESETKIAGGVDRLTYCAYSVRKGRAQGDRLSRYSVLTRN